MNPPIKLQLPSTNPSQTNVIPAFLLKVRNLLDDPTNNDLICWNLNNNDGDSFIIFDQTRFAKEVLPQYFKHNNLASFIRQLNMYGFKKITNIDQGGLLTRDDMEFHNPYFVRDNPALMEHIKRKGAALKDKLTEYGSLQPAIVPDVLVEIRDLKDAQDSYSQQLNVIKKENSRLWQDVAKLRYQHTQQQLVINKLLHFITAVAGKCRGGGKRKLPMLPVGPSAKIPKGATLSSSGDNSMLQEDELSNTGYETSANNAMTIRDITDDATPSEEDQQIIPSTVTLMGPDDNINNVVITIPDKTASSPNPRTFKTQFSDNLQDVQSNIDILKDLFAHSDALDLPNEDLEKLFDGNFDTPTQMQQNLNDAGIADLIQPITGSQPMSGYQNEPNDFEGLMNELANASQGEELSALDDLMYPLNNDAEEEPRNSTVVSSHDLD
ncbi:heat shock factor protein 1-like isoform X2 [Watersipora subatra]|uniref:heat shock factor protein 1-like isoform X2 n=1 Tax=Watersipora subatra TaxID=2589382 RepID=UPI00355B2951